MHKVGSDFWPGSILSSRTFLHRCPTECRLSSSEGRWQAQVSIRLTVDMYGALLQRPTITPFGGIITLTSDVEERIRRAQLAILNPSTTTERFLTVGLPFSETNELRFSKNSIILDISGPRVPDLAFVDLPGLKPAILLWYITNCDFQVSLFLGAPMATNGILKTSRRLSAVILRNRIASFS